jgi:hypothetical protein
LIGRLADVGTKFLTKHESVPYCRFPGHAGEAPIGDFVIARLEDSVDIIAHSRSSMWRLRGVNRDRKGLRIGEKASARIVCKP